MDFDDCGQSSMPKIGLTNRPRGTHFEVWGQVRGTREMTTRVINMGTKVGFCIQKYGIIM